MKFPRPMLILAVLAVGMLTLGASSCDTQTGQNTKQKAQATVHSVGQPVRVGDVQWTVTDPKVLGATLNSTDGFTPPKTAQGGGKFIQVTYKVENLGKEMKTTTGADLEDSKGRQFKAITDGFSYQPQNRQLNVLSNLNPNVSQEFDLIYEVPADAAGFKARVGNLQAIDNKVELVNLGI